MNNIEFNLWLLVLHNNNKTELMNHNYTYEYSKDELTELFLTKYKYYPLNLILDKRYSSEFKLVHSTEDLKNIKYKTIDCGINYIRLKNKTLFEGDMKDENNR